MPSGFYNRRNWHKARWGFNRTTQGLCLNCHKLISYYKSHKRKFCSHKCYSEYKIDKHIGGNHIKGRMAWNKGKKFPQFSKENHPNWKGGITPLSRLIRSSSQFKEWKKQVFERDNYICQDCGQKNVYLEAHHIKSFAQYPELRFAIDNGQTLCNKCHLKTKKGRRKKCRI